MEGSYRAIRARPGRGPYRCESRSGAAEPDRLDPDPIRWGATHARLGRTGERQARGVRTRRAGDSDHVGRSLSVGPARWVPARPSRSPPARHPAGLDRLAQRDARRRFSAAALVLGSLRDRVGARPGDRDRFACRLRAAQQRRSAGDAVARRRRGHRADRRGAWPLLPVLGTGSSADVRRGDLPGAHWEPRRDGHDGAMRNADEIVEKAARQATRGLRWRATAEGWWHGDACRCRASSLPHEPAASV